MSPSANVQSLKQPFNNYIRSRIEIKDEISSCRTFLPIKSIKQKDEPSETSLEYDEKKPYNPKYHEKSDIFNQSTLAMSFVSNQDDLMNDEYCMVGLVIAFSHQSHKVCTATGYQIDTSIVISCTHALQLDQQQYCEEVMFIPGCSSKTDINKYQRYRLHRKLVCSSADLIQFQKKTINRQLTLFKIDEEYDVENRRIEVISYKDMLDDQIEIVGYRNTKVAFNSQEGSITKQIVQRVTLKGRYFAINQKDHQISYNLPTCPGLSGAPIFAKYKNSEGQTRTGIIGLHTHGPKKIGVVSKGLLFTKQMKHIFDQFLLNLQ